MKYIYCRENSIPIQFEANELETDENGVVLLIGGKDNEYIAAISMKQGEWIAREDCIGRE